MCVNLEMALSDLKANLEIDPDFDRVFSQSFGQYVLYKAILVHLTIATPSNYINLEPQELSVLALVFYTNPQF